MPARSTSQSGFTLVELMIALVIIGVMAAAIMPSLSEVLADSRQIGAAHDLVQLARRARANALGSGIAYMLRFRANSGGGLGYVDVFSGMNGKCLQTNWKAAVTAPTDNSKAALLGAREALNMADYTAAGTDSTRQMITLRAAMGDSANLVDQMCICYQPNGEAYTQSNTNANDPTFARQTTFIHFQVIRSTNGQLRGQTRDVIFPVGGNARVR